MNLPTPISLKKKILFIIYDSELAKLRELKKKKRQKQKNKTKEKKKNGYLKENLSGTNEMCAYFSCRKLRFKTMVLKKEAKEKEKAWH